MGEALVKILMGLGVLGIGVVLLVLYIVLAVRNPRHLKRRWKPGFVLGSVLFVMVFPGTVFSIIHLDTSAIEEHMRMPFLIGLILGAVLQFVKIGWHLILYVVAIAEWHRAGSGGPLGGRARAPLSWGRTAGAFAIGAVVAVASLAVFALLGVKEGDFFITLEKLFPTASSASPFVAIPVLCLLLTAAAVSEELVFRGGLMALVIRKNRSRPVVRSLGIILITLSWSFMHFPNTDTPLAKIVQVFLFGLILAEIARRDSLRSAIAAHIGLNVTSVIAAYLWTGF